MTAPLFYGTASGFTTYFTARGVDVSAFTDSAVINAKLLVASEWLDARYRVLFSGWKVGLRNQVREFPRIGGMDIYGYTIASDSNPTEIENATYEATLRELNSPGSLSLDFSKPKYLEAAVDGAIRVKFNNFDQVTDIQIQIQKINEILAPILTGGLNSPLSGASVRA